MIYHYHKIKFVLFIFNTTKRYLLCPHWINAVLRTTLRKYNVGVYTSGNDIAMHLRLFVLIAYICGFRKDSKMIEYTKDKWIDQNHPYVLQWTRNAQNNIRYDNELKLI